jgi:diketogulonate reductase-like aldo/keto reductase
LQAAKVDERAQIEAIKFGIDRGLTLLDTAEVYAEGYSEIIIGKAIKGIRDKVFLATKFSPENSGFKQVIASAESSMSRLGTEYLDLYQAHWPNPSIPIQETMSALGQLVDSGKVKNIGLSNFSKREMIAAQQIVPSKKIFSNQLEYNLFDRFVEHEILPYCKHSNALLIAYSPLDQGRNGISHPTNKLLNELSKKYEKTHSQLSLNWLVSRGNVVPIPKATNLKHIEENADSLNFEISAEDLELIDSAFNSNPQLIPINEINVSVNGEGSRKVYQTRLEALENKLNLAPSPVELSEVIRSGELTKPVRLILRDDVSTGLKYDLIEGRLRYWAWVIAFNGEKPVPAYVRYA